MVQVVSGGRGRWGVLRVPAWGHRGHLVLLVAVLVLGVGLVVLSPLSSSKAQPGVYTSQGRIFLGVQGQGRRFVGGITALNEWWGITTGRPFGEHPDTFPRPGDFVVEFRPDSGAAIERTVTEIVPYERGIGLVMVRFDQALPADRVRFPRIADQPPARYTPAFQYGWEQEGRNPNRQATVVYDPYASANAELLRSEPTNFAAYFTQSSEPMVLNMNGQNPGNVGSGLFTPQEVPGVGLVAVLSGVYVGNQPYRIPDEHGRLTQTVFLMAYVASMVAGLKWVKEVMARTRQGAPTDPGSSSNPPRHEDLRRRLGEAAGKGLPMTAPPPADFCDTGAQCTATTWKVATLTVSGERQGSVAVNCAKDAKGGCSFNGTSYTPGESARLPLRDGCTGADCIRREVVIWCRTNGSLNGTPARSLLRFSFTNADHVKPFGEGWWDVNPEQLTSRQGSLNTASLTQC